MLTLKVTDARANFSKLIQNVQNEPIAIKKYGKCVAIVLTAEEYSKVQRLILINKLLSVNPSLV